MHSKDESATELRLYPPYIQDCYQDCFFKLMPIPLKTILFFHLQVNSTCESSDHKLSGKRYILQVDRLIVYKIKIN